MTQAMTCAHCGLQIPDITDDKARKWRGYFYHDACLAWVFGDDDAPAVDPARARWGLAR